MSGVSGLSGLYALDISESENPSSERHQHVWSHPRPRDNKLGHHQTNPQTSSGPARHAHPRVESDHSSGEFVPLAQAFRLLGLGPHGGVPGCGFGKNESDATHLRHYGGKFASAAKQVVLNTYSWQAAPIFQEF